MNVTDIELTDTQKELLFRLNPRQQNFVINLVKGMNQTEAYKNAGYNPSSDANARVMASKLLTNVNIKSAYDELCKPNVENRAKRAVLTREDAIEGLVLGFKASMRIHEMVKVVNDTVMTEFGEKEIQVYLMEDPKNLPKELAAGIKDVVVTSRGARPVFHSRVEIFKELAKVEGWIKASEADGAVGDSLLEAYNQICGKTKGRPENDE